jgi:RNA polymerase primary sigma factor
VATEEKFGRIKQLMSSGKERGYVSYDEVNELLTEEYPATRELDDLLTELDGAGVEILEAPAKLASEQAANGALATAHKATQAYQADGRSTSGGRHQW